MRIMGNLTAKPLSRKILLGNTPKMFTLVRHSSRIGINPRRTKMDQKHSLAIQDYSRYFRRLRGYKKH
jgi:hypothetical protein